MEAGGCCRGVRVSACGLMICQLGLDSMHVVFVVVVVVTVCR